MRPDADGVDVVAVRRGRRHVDPQLPVAGRPGQAIRDLQVVDVEELVAGVSPLTTNRIRVLFAMNDVMS